MRHLILQLRKVPDVVNAVLLIQVMHWRSPDSFPPRGANRLEGYVYVVMSDDVFDHVAAVVHLRHDLIRLVVMERPNGSGAPPVGGQLV